ncbi:hypothetical protein M8C21_018764, partial [Ambrosia artemisiifolia]
MAAAIYSLYIINKSGGLIFYKDYGLQGRMDTNDSLRLASLWHSMHAISQQLSPVQGCSGIELLEADTFDLHCFQSLTGTKFFVVSEPGTQNMENLLKHIYELYTDYVLKNPFYEMEMPIRCELFDINLAQAVQKDRVSYLGRVIRIVENANESKRLPFVSMAEISDDLDQFSSQNWGFFEPNPNFAQWTNFDQSLSTFITNSCLSITSLNLLIDLIEPRLFL